MWGCGCSRVSPLSLAVDGSSNAICSASSDRESSTGRALRRDMDSLRLMIFILSIFNATPPGPTGLRECKGQQPISLVSSSAPSLQPPSSSSSVPLFSQWLHTHCPVNLHCTVKLLQCSLCTFSTVLWAPNDCVCSRGVCSHCYASQVQTLQDKRCRMREQTHRDTEKQNERD